MIAWKLLMGACWLIVIPIACALAAIVLLAVGLWLTATLTASALTGRKHP